METSRHLLLDALDAFIGGMALYDKTGGLLIANKCYASFFPELTGMKVGDRFEDQLRQRLLKKAIPDAIGCEDAWLEERLSSFNNIKASSREVQYPDGRWIQTNEQGVSSGILRTLVDITANKNQALKLAASEQRFKDFASCAADVFWETDADFNYRFIGGRVDQLLGRSIDSLIGKPLILLSDETDFAEFTNRTSSLPWHQQRSFHQLHVHHTLPNSGYRMLSISGMPIYTAEKEFDGYRGTLTDITEPDKLHQRLLFQANHDQLTGLLNRRSFDVKLQNAFDSAKANHVVHVLCYLDLDHFKLINDTGGHEAGDEMLKLVTRTIQQQIRSSDTVARLGGDEFALLLPHCSIEKSESLAKQIVKAISGLRLEWKGNNYQVGVCIGLVEINRETITTSEATASADMACYAAKESGQNRIYLYDKNDNALLKRRAEALQVREVRKAMAEPGRMGMYFQPIATTKNPYSTPTHYELLLRLFDESGEVTLPGLFIAAAERYALMEQVDRWVVKHVFSTYSELLRANPALKFSINLSGQTLSDPHFGKYMLEELDKSECPPRQICFEITETAAISNINLAVEFMTTMRNLGCQFALDDFGAGLSSLSQLQRLPVDFLKIDGSLVKHIKDNETEKTMVQSICNIGKSMNLAVVAEFVEDEETLQLLKKLGVDHVQGYHIGRPSPDVNASITALSSC